MVKNICPTKIGILDHAIRKQSNFIAQRGVHFKFLFCLSFFISFLLGILG